MECNVQSSCYLFHDSLSRIIIQDPVSNIFFDPNLYVCVNHILYFC